MEEEPKKPGLKEQVSILQAIFGGEEKKEGQEGQAPQAIPIDQVTNELRERITLERVEHESILFRIKEDCAKRIQYHEDTSRSCKDAADYWWNAFMKKKLRNEVLFMENNELKRQLAETQRALRELAEVTLKNGIKEKTR